MRALLFTDIPFIVASLQQMRTESPVYAECADDPDYVTDRLKWLIHNKQMLGVVEEHTGFLLYTLGSSWYCADVYANEQLLYVRPELRGTSTAYRLVKKFIQDARQASAKYCAAGASSGINDAGTLKLYIRAGFEPWKHGVRLKIGD